MTRQKQIDGLAEIGVDFAGFIFYKQSARYALHHLTKAKIRRENRLKKVGVFVNENENDVLRIIDECRLDLVQLHGDESPKYCESIAEYVAVIKAFRISDDDAIEWNMRAYMEACDMFMFDTMGAGYGGTGKKFNWKLLSGEAIEKMFFLSGGIEPDDVNALHEFENSAAAKNLFAVDINSRFEIRPGVKDMEKVNRFVKALNKSNG